MRRQPPKAITMQRVRTFVAIDLDGAVRQQMESQIEYLSQSAVDVKWVDRDQFHLTLKFLGEIAEVELAEVCRAVQRAAAATADFQVDVRGLGAFPSLDHPRTLWMGIDDRSGDLNQLYRRLEDAFSSLGFRAERRQFHGHLTLGRVRHAGGPLGDLAERLVSRRDRDFGTLAVDELVVYSSQLMRQGPLYEPLGHFPLKSSSL